MAIAVYVSRIGRALDARRLTVPRLQERLAARGYHVSRGALARLASDEPIEEVRLAVLRPVLDELELTFEEAFDQIDRADVEARRKARSDARRLAGLATVKEAEGAAESGDPDDELREVIARSLAQLRAVRPDLVDRRGRVRRRVLAKAIAERLGDARTLTAEEYSRLIAPGLTDSRSAALLREPDA